MEEADKIYNMIIGHSQFVPIMFSASKNDQPQKGTLLKVILALLKNHPKVCLSSQIPIYLGAYSGSLSQVDQTLLEILYIHEIDASINLNVFKPLVWGQAVIAKHSASVGHTKNINGNGTAMKSMKTSEILALIKSDKMTKSSLNFPLAFDENLNREELYDPRFFLSLSSQLCAKENFVDKHLKLIESGILGMSIASLSCREENIRQMGIVSLYRYYIQPSPDTRLDLVKEPQLSSL